MDTQSQELWERIVAKGLAQDSLFEQKLHLYAGATEENLNQVEQILELTLPEQIKSFYRIHNGQSDEVESTCFLRNLTLSPLAEVIENWTFLQEEFDPEELGVDAQQGIKPVAWNTKWIPIASNGGGDYLCIDTDPTEEGTVGQVLYFWHDWEYRSVEATSFFEFVEIALQEEIENTEEE